jgi:L-lactate dehydrogenase
MADTTTTEPVRVAVVGAGNVGATYAHHLLLRGLAAEIVLINRDRDRAEGEAMDLTHTVPWAQPTRIWAGGYEDCAGAAVTVLTAGANPSEGESRLDVLQKNAGIFREIVPEVARRNPRGVILVASNPVDVLTYAAWKLSGLPASQVIGSGTILDTARFRTLLGECFEIDPHNVHGYVLGEHGDSQVAAWSLTNIAGMRLPEYCSAHGLEYDQERMDGIAWQTRDAAKAVVEGKGATYYGVAGGLVRITEAVLRDQHAVLSVSTLIEGYEGICDVCLSLPCIVDRGGIERVLHPTLTAEEREALRRSAQVLREAASGLELG